jgi:DNA polymerase (family X)
MENRQIAKLFDELSRLMEYHGESIFKIRSYQQAYQQFRSVESPIILMNKESLVAIPGIGETIADKVIQIQKTGSFDTLDNYRTKTPMGVQEMLNIKGLGPKKVKLLIDGLEIQTPGELLYACEENRLVSLHGFGAKSQESIAEKIRFYLKSKDKQLYSQVAIIATELLLALKSVFPESRFELTGEIRRKMQTISAIDILTDSSITIKEKIPDLEHLANEFRYKGVRVNFHVTKIECWGTAQILITGGIPEIESQNLPELSDEKIVFEKIKFPYIIPERRDPVWHDRWSNAVEIPEIMATEIKGVLHAHSLWSDGSSSIEDLALYCQKSGYEFLGITDHSKSAGYAGGLSIDRLLQQIQEIDQINEQLEKFTIFKGIESDILNDGQLDYPDEILEHLDFVIASIHSVLQMDEQRATNRIIRAIENPYTNILGHPSGRLLLSRAGYPLNYPKILDAAAANGVAVEINANPNRLDLDYTWIPYAMEKGIFMCINPDAHYPKGIHDIQYGLIAANKGGLLKEQCLSCFSTDDLTLFFKQKRSLTKR